jgi:hypothetical protein
MMEILEPYLSLENILTDILYISKKTSAENGKESMEFLFKFKEY